VKRLGYGVYAATRCDRLVWRLSRKRLRVLAYHGVCEDEFAGEWWMPPYFVTRSAFSQQMEYLRRHACVMSLDDAISRMSANDLPDRAVAITFDDGYANNLHVAHPILKMHDVPATIFLATGYVERGSLFPYDRVRLIDQVTNGRAWHANNGRRPLLSYRSHPIDHVIERVEEWWPTAHRRLTAPQIETLRPLCADELSAFDDRLVRFGAHTHSHCILRNETADRRSVEILTSIRKTSALARRPVEVFSYPNGQRGDYDERDKQTIRSAGIRVAVTSTPGTIGHHDDRLELRRYSVGLGHTLPSFAAEITGLRALFRNDAVVSVKRKSGRSSEGTGGY
jgi:peptidoglycan/xylan/chitin deacetylase (PgdA/CDA1 family)